jgi:hypothetical protein
MRFLIIAAVLISALPAAGGAFAQTAPRPAPPNIGETQDAGKKAEYLESKTYKPCLSSVRFPNGQAGVPWLTALSGLKSSLIRSKRIIVGERSQAPPVAGLFADRTSLRLYLDSKRAQVCKKLCFADRLL